MAVSLPFLSAGDVIGDKYSVVQVIGCGGMGIVYEATHLRLRQRVAVKMLLPDVAQAEGAVTRFEREARAAAHLRSPHVARVFDVDALPDGAPFMVMEFLEGRDLAEELANRGPFSVADAVDCLLQVCDAMAEAHGLGIVHRDLKPANIFLADDGRHSIVKVLDFGISKVLNEAAPGVTTTQSGLGTAVYMSPEQVRSAKSVDARSDVWALGVVLYEMLTGCQPFSGDSATAVAAAITADTPAPLRSMRDDVPPELERVVMKALEKERTRRFSDAAAFAAAIAPFASRRLERGSAPRITPTPASAVRNAGPTLESPRGSYGPTNDGLVSGKLRSSPPRGRVRARVETWSRSRSLWTLAVLSAAVLSSLALVREVARPSAPARSSSSELPQVLASPLTPAVRSSAGPATDVLPPPSEIRVETAAAQERPPNEEVAVTSVGTSRPSTPFEATKARSRAAAISPSSPGAGKEMTRAVPSGERPMKPKNTYGLPPDPG